MNSLSRFKDRIKRADWLYEFIRRAYAAIQEKEYLGIREKYYHSTLNSFSLHESVVEVKP